MKESCKQDVVQDLARCPTKILHRYLGPAFARFLHVLQDLARFLVTKSCKTCKKVVKLRARLFYLGSFTFLLRKLLCIQAMLLVSVPSTHQDLYPAMKPQVHAYVYVYQLHAKFTQCMRSKF